MPTVAFHGQFASGRVLRRDMGDPAWVNRYHDGLDVWDALKQLDGDEILIGYSKGGSLIGHLSHEIPIKAAVLYESPLLGIDHVEGTFPVLWIANAYRRSSWRTREMQDTLSAWRRNHEVNEMIGQGRHTRWVCGWPPIGHAWDRSLNERIGRWIASVKSS